MKQTEIIHKFILQNIKSHPRDIVLITTQKFGITRTAVQKHLRNLIASGKLLKSGNRNKTSYFFPQSLSKTLVFEIEKALSESDVWLEYFKPLQTILSSNTYDICFYGFTEIFNNAIDHSQGKTIRVVTQETNQFFIINIYDDGIGIFKKIKDSFGLQNEKESILHLSKGKLTTDPENHSGEGIFFTSKAFDEFIISANGLLYLRDNQEDDWALERKKHNDTFGTLVSMKINLHSQRDLKKIFDKYTNKEDKTFDKTHIFISLSQSNEDRFISRSQARRILFGLENFQHIILDFSNVTTVGQAFVDEVFRVFQNAHPKIKLETIHTNEEIEFMINRGLATAAQNKLITPTLKKNKNLK